MMDGALYQKELELLMKEAISYLKAWQEKFLEKGIAAQIRVVNGPVVHSIVECAENENADLITIASHGYSGLSRVFYGSSAAGVLNNSERPLLVIRSREN